MGTSQVAKKTEFLEYYQLWKDRVYSYFWYRTGFDRDLAEDLTSEVFIKALKHFDSFDQEKSFSAWVFTIARNHLINHFAKIKPTAPLEAAVNVAGMNAKDIISSIDVAADHATVMKEIQQLSDYHRDVIILRYVDGLSNKEIAEVLEKDEGAIRVQMSRALAELRKRCSITI